jgi:hypothetical protein
MQGENLFGLPALPRLPAEGRPRGSLADLTRSRCKSRSNLMSSAATVRMSLPGGAIDTKAQPFWASTLTHQPCFTRSVERPLRESLT